MYHLGRQKCTQLERSDRIMMLLASLYICSGANGTEIIIFTTFLKLCEATLIVLGKPEAT